jgi:hypothetical protein
MGTSYVILHVPFFALREVETVSSYLDSMATDQRRLMAYILIYVPLLRKASGWSLYFL